MKANPARQAWAYLVKAMPLLPVLYALSLGPTCWVSSWTGIGDRAVSNVYRPLMTAWDDPDESEASSEIAGLLRRYAEIGAAEGWIWFHCGTVGVQGGVPFFGENEWHWGHFIVRDDGQPTLKLRPRDQHGGNDR